MLASAQSEAEKTKVEEKMRSDNDLSQILNALEETEKEDMVQEERARRHAARQSRVAADLESMDVDEGGVCTNATSIS